MVFSKRILMCLVFSLAVLLPEAALWAQPAGQIPCNADIECPDFCLEGICQDPTCNNDSDCRIGRGPMACISGHCESVDCDTAEDCSTGKACINHRCEGCENNAQCGEHGVCRNDECVCVECRNNGNCAIDQNCSPNNECVDFCEADEIFVARQDGDRLCKTCINPASAQRCNEFPGCRDGAFCAQGFCIRRCGIQPPDFDELDELLQELEEILTQPAPGGLPDCPRCTIGFEMISMRGVLERAGITKPVHIRLLDSSGKLVADFGTFSPKGQSWATIPELMQPKLMQSVASQGSCGYMLEISDLKSKKAARGAVCLEPRKKPLPLQRTL